VVFAGPALSVTVGAGGWEELDEPPAGAGVDGAVAGDPGDEVVWATGRPPPVPDEAEVQAVRKPAHSAATAVPAAAMRRLRAAREVVFGRAASAVGTEPLFLESCVIGGPL